MDPAQVLSNFDMLSRQEQEAEIAAMRAAKQKPKKKTAQMTKQQIKRMEESLRTKADEKNKTRRTFLIRKIRSYYDNPSLREKIKIDPPRITDKITTKELETLAREIEYDLGSHDAAPGLYMVLHGFAQLVETNIQTETFRLDGPVVSLSEAISQSEASFYPLLTELSIKYNTWFTMSVEMRLIASLAITMKHVADVNSSAGNVPLDPRNMGRKVDPANFGADDL